VATPLPALDEEDPEDPEALDVEAELEPDAVLDEPEAEEPDADEVEEPSLRIPPETLFPGDFTLAALAADAKLLCVFPVAGLMMPTMPMLQWFDTEQ